MSFFRPLIIASSLLMAGAALAVPTTINYSGTLRQNGQPKNGTVQLVVELYTAAEGGTPVFSENQSETVSDGQLLLDIGATATLDDSILGSDELWMTLVVDGIAMEPRVKVGSVPYALRAQDAETVGGVSAAELAAQADALQTSITALQSQLETLQNQISGLTFANINGVPADLLDGDQDTKYTAGTGLTLTGTTFSIPNDAINEGRLANASITPTKLKKKRAVYGYLNKKPSPIQIGEPFTEVAISDSCTPMLGLIGRRTCDGVCASFQFGQDPPSCPSTVVGYVVSE